MTRPIYKVKRHCIVCDKTYLSIEFNKPRRKTTGVLSFICSSCQVQKDVPGDETCNNCIHFNLLSRLSDQENRFFRRCAKNRVSDHDDCYKDDGYEPCLVYYKDRCSDYERKETE